MQTLKPTLGMQHLVSIFPSPSLPASKPKDSQRDSHRPASLGQPLPTLLRLSPLV
jgi:hypothetical protein